MKKFRIKVRRTETYEYDFVVEAPSRKKAMRLLENAETQGFLESSLSVASDVKSTYGLPVPETDKSAADFSWNELTQEEIQELSF